MEIKRGTILLSEPFLGDPNFVRSVILICEHNEEGSFGLILNKETHYNLSDVLDIEVENNYGLFLGGPVEVNTLHFIHRLPELIDQGLALSDLLHWGGDFEELKSQLEAERVPSGEIRFFLGYAGWESKQLESELDENVWIVFPEEKTGKVLDNLLDLPPQELWSFLLKEMGGSYAEMANYPIDPRLN